MKNFIKFTLMLLVLITIASCNPYFYMPTKHNVLPFNEKGDIMLAVSAGLNDNFAVDAGYSITDNIGVTTSFNSLDISASGNSKYLNNDYIWDSELVLYKKINKNMFSGINMGAGWGKYNTYSAYYNYNFNRQYVLPWFVYKSTISSFEKISTYVGLSTKFSRVNYGLNPMLDLSSDYDRQMFYNYFELENLNKERFISEIGFTFGIDFEKIKIQIQNQNVIFPSKQDYILPSNLTVSVYFYLNNFFKKK